MDINRKAELAEAQHREAKKAKNDEAYRDAHRKVLKREDNFNFVTTPMNREEYPYDKLTKAGQFAPLPPSKNTFTDAAYPKIHIPFRKLVEDLSRGQKAALKEDHEQYIVVIPFGAGPKFYQSYTTLKQDVVAFLDGFQIEKGDYRISLPSECLSKKVQDYQTPWPFFIEGAATLLQNFLLWQQTFPIDKKLVLNFLPVDINFQSWVIATYRCGAVKNDTARIARALRKIKKATCKNRAITDIVNKICTSQGFTGHVTLACEEMTHSWNLEYIRTLQNDSKIRVWQLTGKPITTNDDDHRKLVNAIRSLTVMVGMDNLKADGKARLECIWCKSEMHQSHACPFPDMVPGWRGPTREKMNKKAKQDSPESRSDTGQTRSSFHRAGRGG
ncbi:hypothetical protein EDD18DRAFT_1354121 [Armillaria luteobubalina]|uniref:Uncharacterized protein n=1 Tax=Armillaria luteobubalina TaxID=153913 RepID=A0AA39Q4R3_9AGAR|nr:hypothetical protein EDD18DRAFT_1354121 [Armillaria luteobubalina]